MDIKKIYHGTCYVATGRQRATIVQLKDNKLICSVCYHLRNK